MKTTRHFLKSVGHFAGYLALSAMGLAGVNAQSSYVKGDFHQHSTYTDGSWSIGHMMQKNNQFGLDWWANSEHGGGYTKNGRFSGTDKGTTVYWDDSNPSPIIGKVQSSGGHQAMWRWQMLRDSSFAQIQAARLLYPTKVILQSYEMNVPGHEHGSMGLIANQFGVTPNCNPLAEFEFKFDNSDIDDTGGTAQGWAKSVLSGHAKTLEAISWLQTNYKTTSYLIPAHPERQKLYTIAHFRDMNNAGSDVCFGFESMPGHQKTAERGGYSSSADGGGTFGGCGYYAATIGGLWDAMLSEGRKFWLFASSDFHDEAGDFYPGEYQKTYTNVSSKTAQGILDGLRAGNSWIVEGDLIDSLDFKVETINKQDNVLGTMGSSVLVNKGKSLKITIKARDPQGNNNNTYSSYTNPSLDHIDVVKGKIQTKIDPANPNYNIPSTATTSVIGRFDAVGGITDSGNLTSQKWKSTGNGWVEMTLIVPNVTDSVYFRLRGTNLGLNVSNETDAAGNPLPDNLVGSNDAVKAFADLWFYSNPIFVYTTNTITKKVQITTGSDDLEERLAPEAGQTQSKTIGEADWTSSDLELGCEGGAAAEPQLIGVRFPGINLPKNTTINNAYLEFEVDVATSKVDPCNLTIWTEDNDNPATFSNTPYILTSRPKSTKTVSWNVDVNSLNVLDKRYLSANIAGLVQDNVNRAGWNAGNAMAFYIKGNGRREMESYEGEPTAAAALVIEYNLSNQDIKNMQTADSIAYLLQTKSDSILNVVNKYAESDYTIPSWTDFLRAKKALLTNSDSTAIANLITASNKMIPAQNPYNVVVTINGNPSSNMGFNWFTNNGVNGGLVQIVEGKISDLSAFANPSFSFNATSSAVNLNYCVSANGLAGLAGIADNTKKNYTVNKALASGLKPNTTYSYRVGKDGAWSEIGTFTTAKNTKDAFSFVYFTDPQANTDAMFDVSQKTTHAADKMYPNANFWLSCGDLIETSGNTNSEWEYEQFFKTQQDIWYKHPFVPVEGNHDKSLNKNFTYHFNTQTTSFDKNMATLPGSVYSFVYGDALFMGMSYEDYDKVGYLDSLATWMRTQVKAHPEVKWRIAFYHKTMYTGSGSHQSDGDGKAVRDRMAPLFDSLKIDLALQGHDHVYEVIGPVKNKQLVADAVSDQQHVTPTVRDNIKGLLGGTFDVSKGTLYFLNNSAGKKKYEPRTQAQMTAAESTLGISNYFNLFNGRFGQTGEPTFSNITVSTDTIKISTYTVSDAGVPSLFDEFKIVKNIPVNSLQMVYTSDAHYGITRTAFQGNTNVNASVVNAAMINKINTITDQKFPLDNGVNAGKVVGNINYLIETGDISNRSETATNVQSSAASWSQFKNDYIDHLTLVDNVGNKTALLLAPGNHDVSNAIGFYKTLNPLKDSTTMVNIYNMMMPSARTAGAYNYANEKIHYSRNIGGIHFMFVNIWPDSTERVWMKEDLKSVKLTTPVVVFTHDQPSVESKHFTNPNGNQNINATDKFENLLLEKFKDGNKTINDPSTLEQNGLTQFLKEHRNIVAYFHGNDHTQGYYTYHGTDNSIALNTIHVDSPMKGVVSSLDETKLSFQTISIDTISKQISIRECLWNTNPSDPSAPIVFGETKTTTLDVVQNLIALANTKLESDYTVPSWTLLKKAAANALSTKDSTSIANLSKAIENLVDKNKAYDITANINGNPSSQMGFAWFTNEGITGGQVQLVEGETKDVTTFNAPTVVVDASSSSVSLNYNVAANGLVSCGIADNTVKNFTTNKTLATNLKPNTTYSYRVGKDGAWSEIGTFTTAKNTKDAFSFVYFTDPQANTDAMFDVSQKTTHAANSLYPKANFWLSCGDLIETSGNTNSEWEYEQFFTTQQDIWLNKPFAPIAGNHDKSINKNFTNHFNTANPSFDKNLSTTPGSVYSFVYGDALFMALSYEDYSVPGYLDSLAVWMNKQVKANLDVKWRIAFYHKTMYTGSGSHQSDGDGKAVREKMGPVFDSLKIDLALQGHDHIYEVLGPIKNKTLVTGAVSNQTTVTPNTRENITGLLGGTFDVTNGTLYFLNNSAGKKKYEPRSQVQMAAVESGLGITNYFSFFTGRFGQTGEPTFSNISVSSDSIVVSTYTVNDQGTPSLFDKYKVVKGSVLTSLIPTKVSDTGISIYPNPVQNELMIETEKNIISDLSIYNISGTLVYEIQSGGSTKIDMSKFSKGIYFLKVKNSESSSVIKLVKE